MPKSNAISATTSPAKELTISITHNFTRFPFTAILFTSVNGLDLRILNSFIRTWSFSKYITNKKTHTARDKLSETHHLSRVWNVLGVLA